MKQRDELKEILEEKEPLIKQKRGGAMRLRNKKTGEIVKNVSSFDTREFTIGIEYENSKDYIERSAYDSLAELNDEWEDCEPQEPLIKDEKIRKVVRAWAEGNMATRVQYDAFWRGFRNRDASITIWEELPLEDSKTYTIAELCGEEE